MSGLVRMPGPLDLHAVRIHFSGSSAPTNPSAKVLLTQHVTSLTPLPKKSSVGQIVGYNREMFPFLTGKIYSVQEMRCRVEAMAPWMDTNQFRVLFHMKPDMWTPARCGQVVPSDFRQLLSSLHIDKSDVILDPWGVHYLLERSGIQGHKIVNNIYGVALNLHGNYCMDPLSAELYHYTITQHGSIDFIVTCPPADMIDAHLPLLLAAASKAVCMYAPI